MRKIPKTLEILLRSDALIWSVADGYFVGDDDGCFIAPVCDGDLLDVEFYRGINLLFDGVKDAPPIPVRYELHEMRHLPGVPYRFLLRFSDTQMHGSLEGGLPAGSPCIQVYPSYVQRLQESGVRVIQDRIEAYRTSLRRIDIATWNAKKLSLSE